MERIVLIFLLFGCTQIIEPEMVNTIGEGDNRIIINTKKYKGQTLRLVEWKDERGCITNCIINEEIVFIELDQYIVQFDDNNYGIKVDRETIKCNLWQH